MKGRTRSWAFRLATLAFGLCLLLLLNLLLELSPWSPPTREEYNRQHNLLSIEHYYRQLDEYFVVLSGDSLESEQAICGPSETLARAQRSRANGMQWARFPCKKSPGTFRLVTLGGSAVQGFDVSASSTFPSKLQEFLLQEGAKKVEVINAGVAGYNTLQIRRMMPSLAFLEPDLYVLYAGHNDYNYFLVADAAELTPRWQRTLRAMGDRFAIWRLTRAALRHAEQEQVPAAPVWAGVGRPGGAAQSSHGKERSPRPVPESREDRRSLVWQEQAVRRLIETRYRENVDYISRQARKQGAHLLLLSPTCKLSDPPLDSIHWRDLDQSALDSWNQAWAAARRGPGRSRALAAALAIDDTYSELLYMAGLDAVNRGKPGEALERFVSALDYTPPSRCDRAPPRHRQVVSDSARALGLPYMDTWPVFHPSGLLQGDEYFMDTVHLNVEGHALLARQLAGFLLREGLVPQS